jgi:16S rRNA (guanine527-N7)-methyltransferase
LSQLQLDQLTALPDLYHFWNQRINVISRQDIDNIETHHILHSLAIALIIRFSPGTRIMDAGTGGGFPGIPLAILFPEVTFTLVDSTGKKIRVVEEICKETGLQNVKPRNERFEKTPGRFDFITGRAVASLPAIWKLLSPKLEMKESNTLPPGMLYLKGGELKAELDSTGAVYRVFELSDYFPEPYFETKKLVHLYAKS